MYKKILKKPVSLVALLALLAVVVFLFVWEKGINTKSSPAPAVITETTQENTITDSDAFRLTIAKLEVSAPIMKGADPTNEASYNRILQKGVAHMVGTAMPGEEKGNVFIYGHSSANNNPDYGKVFVSLNDLQKGDEIEIYYKGQNYMYKVSGKRIVGEDDLSVLEKTGKEQVTLMTCWPVGTSDKRLIVVAERA